jgi:hypothetical protein
MGAAMTHASRARAHERAAAASSALTLRTPIEEVAMASTSLNPRIQDRVTYNTVETFRHDHTKYIVKGALVALAIVGVGVMTLAMPALGPAWGGAEQVAAERSDSELYTAE